MNLKNTYKLREPIQALLQEASEINNNKPQKYWYPLSMVSYDIEEVLAAVDSLCSFQTTMREKTIEFERQFAKINACSEAIMVNSGSSADLLIAFALVNPQTKLLSPGDEILVPSVTWPTQLWSAMMAGLKIRFVDTDPNTLNMDLNDLEAKIGPKTRAISLVHLMGNPCDMDRVLAICQKYNLILIEDCCEALGAKFKGKPVGSFGIAGSFSFFFSHHITTMEGGMIICQDQLLSDQFRLLRAHGWARNAKYLKPEPMEGLDPRYMFLNWGFNVRPTELQAGFGLEQLRRLPAFNEQRLQNVAHFQKYLDRHSAIMRLMEVLPEAECSWFALPIILTQECPFTKDAFLTYLEEQGVETRPIVAGNLTRQPVCQLYPELQEPNLPGADLVHERGFYIGVHPFEAIKNLDRLSEIFEEFIQRNI
ncbi:MAG: DegT/DnrJ/EryC1/StrS family aminotransferase [Desulfobacteraceae bacterium]|nr:DegT/DnrJ/EryC1/StrS family aminotransferase [Desulfobacteraceae bacterium]